MKIRTLPALLMCLSFPIAALAAKPAHVVRGVIADRDSSEPIGYATASISRDSTVVTAVAAGLDGQFTLPVADKGSYRLNVAAVGYDPFTQEITVGGAVADLDTLRLRPGIEIEQVVVKAQKPLIVSDAEKMTYSVEDDPQASSSTLEEIIRKVPQLSLDADGNVLLNGQSDYKILLNGHQSGSLGSNFKDIIKSMPASQIKKIEVITNPSTKYDAEGVGGILNLVTEKKRAFDGYNGSVRTGTSLLNGFSYYGNANASVQIGKFAASLSAYYSHYENNDNPSTSESHQENFDSQTARFQDSYGKSTYGGNYFGATLDASFQPDTLNLVTLNASLWTGRNRNHDQTNLTVSDPQLDPLFGYLMHNRNRYRYIGGTVGMSYEHTFNRSEHTLTLSDEVEIDPDDYDDFTAFYAVLGPVPTGQFINEKTRKVNNTVQIDYVNPLSEHHQIEAGAKHIYRYNRIMDTYQLEKAGQYVPDTEGPRAAMTYRQHIVALYAGYNLTFDKWAGRLGARMERTWNDANGEERDADTYSFRNRQFNVVPFASLTYKPAERHNLSLSYTQRIQRPNIERLSPAIDDSDPLVIIYGNPDLVAAVFNSLNLQYSYFSTKFSLTFALTNFFSNNYMSYWSRVNEEGITLTTPTNDVHTRSYGFNGSVSLRPSEKVNISLSYRGNYSKYDFREMDIHSDRFSFGENFNMDFSVWPEGRITLGENYSSGDVYLGSKSSRYYNYYVGVKQQFLKKTLEFSVILYNPFNKYTTFESHSLTPTYAATSFWRSPSRGLSFSVSYRFGKQGIGVKSTSRAIENDDLGGDEGKGSGK